MQGRVHSRNQTLKHPYIPKVIINVICPITKYRKCREGELLRSSPGLKGKHGRRRSNDWLFISHINPPDPPLYHPPPISPHRRAIFTQVKFGLNTSMGYKVGEARQMYQFSPPFRWTDGLIRKKTYFLPKKIRNRMY